MLNLLNQTIRLVDYGCCVFCLFFINCNWENFHCKLLADPDGSSSISFPWKCIWSTKAPKRVPFFLWTAARGSVLTIDNLVLRRLPLVNWRCMCRCDEETVDHLLLHCRLAYALWSEVFLIFGIQWVMPKTVASLLFGWWNWPGKHSSNIWNMVPACLIWLIWWECNNHTFEDIVRSIDLLKPILVGTLFQWGKIWGFTQGISISEFLLSLCISS